MMSKIVKRHKLYESYADNSLIKIHIFEQPLSPEYVVHSLKIKKISWICKYIKNKFSEISDLIDDYDIVMTGEVFTKGSTDSPVMTLEFELLTDEYLLKFIKLYTFDILLSFKGLPVDIKDSIRVLDVIYLLMTHVLLANCELSIQINDNGTTLDYSWMNPYIDNEELNPRHCQMFYNRINDEYQDDEKNEYLNRKKNLTIDSANMLSLQFHYNFYKHNIYLADKNDGNYAEVLMKVKPGDEVTAEEILYLYRIFKDYIYPDEYLTFSIDIEGTLVINKEKYSWMSASDVINLFVLNIVNNTNVPEYKFRDLLKR